MNQDNRREHNPEVAQQIEDFLRKLEKYINCDEEILPFTFEINDPSGHSNIKNLMAPRSDPMLVIKKYVRSVEQITAMGYMSENADPNGADVVAPVKDKSQEVIPENGVTMKKEIKANITDIQDKATKHNYTAKETDDLINKVENMNKEDKPLDAHGMNFNKPLEDNINIKDDLKGESLTFETPCHNCGHEGVTRMCTCEIPFFKEIIVMAFTCDKCGSRSSEVKTGGGISEKGRKMTFYVENEDDMNRDLFKSESAEVTINELGLTICCGSLGGLYTTVEGLFMKMIETFRDNNPFMGDSADTGFKSKFDEFINKLERFQDGKEKFTLIIDDPLNNSWLSNPYHPEKDPKVVEVLYERTEEQEIEFGIDA